MVMRIHNTARWNRQAVGVPLIVSGEQGGAVRLEVNTMEPTLFHVVEDQQVTLLGVVFGLEVLDFYCSKVGELVATSENDWWYALPGDGPMVVETDPSFVKVMQRKARNHDLEMIQYKLEENARRREAKQSAEIAVLRDALAQRQAAEAAAAAADPETGEVPNGEGDGAGAAGEAEGGAQIVASAAPVKGARKGAGGDGTSTA